VVLGDEPRRLSGTAAAAAGAAGDTSDFDALAPVPAGVTGDASGSLVVSAKEFADGGGIGANRVDSSFA